MTIGQADDSCVLDYRFTPDPGAGALNFVTIRLEGAIHAKRTSDSDLEPDARRVAVGDSISWKYRPESSGNLGSEVTQVAFLLHNRGRIGLRRCSSLPSRWIQVSVRTLTM
jgi:hypothetical protein